jgi:hypothetical protein
MVSDESRTRIDALPREELVAEIAKAHRSTFQGDNFAYLHRRLAAVDQLAAVQQSEREHRAAADGNQLAAEANQIAREANQLSEQSNIVAKGASATAAKSYRTSVLALVVAVVAAFIAVLQQCAGKP